MRNASSLPLPWLLILLCLTSALRAAPPAARSSDAVSGGHPGIDVEPVQKPDGRLVDDWLGSAFQLGITTLDAQHPGSMGRNIVVSPTGIVHGVWGRIVWNHTLPTVVFWCHDLSDDELVSGPWLPDNVPSRFPSMALTGPGSSTVEPNSMVLALHHENASRSSYNVDVSECIGFFSTDWAGDPDQSWPQLAVDNQQRIHILTQAGPQAALPNSLWYRQAVTDMMVPPGPSLLLAQECRTVSAIAVASHHTARTALVYLQPTDSLDMPWEGEEGGIGRLLHHDVLALIAEDGNLAPLVHPGAGVNLTHWGPGSSSPFGDFGCRAFCDLDGLFDTTPQANLHLVFSTAVMYDDTSRVRTASGDSLSRVAYQWHTDRGQIWHLNVDSGQWSHLAGWNSVLRDPPSRLTPQSGRMCVDRPQLSLDESTGWLYCIWSQYDPEDRNFYGWYNGEILARCSADNGQTWGPAVNLTNSTSPDCDTWLCEAEDWPSVADRVHEGQLHLSFIRDLDAGDSALGEGDITSNPVIHLQVPVALIPPSGTPWNAVGRVGLASGLDGPRWPCADWSGPEAPLRSGTFWQTVPLLNEGVEPAQLLRVDLLHHPEDGVGDGGSALRAVALEVLQDGHWQTARDWDGWMPEWRATRLRLSVSHTGLPGHDQLLRLRIAGQPDLLHRIAWQSEDQPGCPDVDPLDMDQAQEFASLTLWCPGCTPRTPRDLRIAIVANRVRLHWEAVTQFENGTPLNEPLYLIHRQDAQGQEILLAQTRETALDLPGEYGSDRVGLYRVSVLSIP